MMESHLVRVFTGNNIEGKLLIATLEESGISTIVRNGFQSGAIAGFGGGLPQDIDVYIHENDLKKAEELIENFS